MGTNSYADDLTREEIEILREDLLADTAWLEGGKERVRRLCAMAFRASSGSLKNAAPQGAPMATRGVTGSSPVASTPAGAASYRVLGMYCKKHGGRGWTDTDLDQFDRIVCPGCNPSFMPPTGPNDEGYPGIAHDFETLRKFAAVIRDAFHYDPGHSDLDREQPIHISTTLGAWRNLDYALRATNCPTKEEKHGND